MLRRPGSIEDCSEFVQRAVEMSRPNLVPNTMHFALWRGLAWFVDSSWILKYKMSYEKNVTLRLAFNTIIPMCIDFLINPQKLIMESSPEYKLHSASFAENLTKVRDACNYNKELKNVAPDYAYLRDSLIELMDCEDALNSLKMMYVSSDALRNLVSFAFGRLIHSLMTERTIVTYVQFPKELV